jgi:hypothetical protein
MGNSYNVPEDVKKMPVDKNASFKRKILII